jgi:hypothetical protein
MSKNALDVLKEASNGLLYPSESDEPFEVVAWGKAEGELTPATLTKLASTKPSAKVEEVALDKFFDFLMQPVEGAPEEENPEMFKQLRKAVTEQLTDARVYRIGKVNIDIYIVGKTKEGEWAGLKTKAVET